MIRLSAKNLSSGYGDKEIISNISLDAKPGSLIVLVGPNGSGKSTLIKTLAGLLPAKQGDVLIDDQPLQNLDLRVRAKQIAYLAQDRQAMPSMNVRQILELGRAPYRGRLGQISHMGEVAIMQAINYADLKNFLHRPFSQLSGGEQARVLMGRALAVDAPILLADEPIAALDPYYQLAMMEILKAETSRGKTVITALHDLSLTEKYADEIWVMDKGKVVFNDVNNNGLPAELVEQVFKIHMIDGRISPIKVGSV